MKGQLNKFNRFFFVLQWVFILSLVGGILSSCSDGPADGNSGLVNSNLTEIPGKGVPAAEDVRVKVVSDSEAVVVETDTLLLEEFNPDKWDRVLDTLIDSTLDLVNPPGYKYDTNLVVEKDELKPVIDTTYVLTDAPGGTFVFSLPAGGYTLKPEIKGEYKEFYDSPDSTITSDGVTPVSYIPVFTPVPFGHLSGYIYSALDSTPLFDEIEIKLDKKNLEKEDKFYTDATGFFEADYVPIGPRSVEINANGLLDSIYLDAEGEFNILEGETTDLVYYLEAM